MSTYKCVYVHRRLDNDSVFYIGIGSKKRPYVKYGRNKHWQSIVKKYGYYVDVLFKNLTMDDAKELECFLIENYGIDNLTNYTNGGDGLLGYKHTKESKLKIAKFQTGKHKGVDNPFYGKKHTDEVKKLISDKQCKKVINIKTGETYRSAKDAAEILCYPISTLTKYLNGISINKTDLRYE